MQMDGHTWRSYESLLATLRKGPIVGSYSLIEDYIITNEGQKLYLCIGVGRPVTWFYLFYFDILGYHSSEFKWYDL